MANEQLTTKIREALKQLDPADDQQWTDDGLPREGLIRKLAADPNISRKDISDAWPGFERTVTADAPPKPQASTLDQELEVTAGSDPTQNTGEFMTQAEVQTILQNHVEDAQRELIAAQVAVREANSRVSRATAAVLASKQELASEFPPKSAAQNVKEYIASEQAMRAANAGFSRGLAPGSQIDAAMQRSNSRGWRRPTRRGQTVTGGVNPPREAPAA